MDGVINEYFVFFKIKFKWAILFYLIKKYQSSPNHLLQNIQLKKKIPRIFKLLWPFSLK